VGDGEIFNIATGVQTTDYQIFEAVREALGIAPFEPTYAPKRPGEVDHIVLEISKARSKLGWQPQVELRQGVRRTAEWFKRTVASP
jgi:UDP-glucose 4-epimerase